MTGRTLVLLRHAKAAPPDGIADAERPLTARGRDDAGAAGAWLARRQLRPELVLCSPATRTRQTWHGVAVALGISDATAAAPEVHYDPPLYYGGADEALKLIHALPDSVHTVLVVGHNPTISHLSALLSPNDPAGDLEGLRTCGLAVHRRIGAWSAWAPGTGQLVDRHTARA